MLRLVIDERTDDVTQRRQTLIDVDGLLEAVTSCVGLTLPLRTSQIDHVQLTHLYVVLSSLYFICLYDYHEQ